MTNLKTYHVNFEVTLYTKNHPYLKEDDEIINQLGTIPENAFDELETQLSA